MHAMLAEVPLMTTASDTASAVPDLVRRWLLRPAGDQPDLVGLLAELAEVFNADHVGLLGLADDAGPCYPAGSDRPSARPWCDSPSLLQQARSAPGAVGCEGGPHRSGRLLFTLVPVDGQPHILWLEDDQRSDWSTEDLAALSLAGHALARFVENGTPRQAEQLDRSLRQQRMEMTANVTRRLAHDFGNVLTGILGFTELALAQQVPPNTPLHTYLQEVYRAAQAGAVFTHQLRLFSRRQSATSRSCSLASALMEQEARLFAANPTGLSFRYNAPKDLPHVALDAEHLHHVLTALLDNAREALIGSGSITASARVMEVKSEGCQNMYGNLRPGMHVEIVIADTGVGLSLEAQRKLFAEPFFTTKPRRRGFGLAIAYGVLHAHHGGMQLHAGEERGVVARVLLPVAPVVSQPPPTPVETVIRPSERLRGDRILLVDDEAEVLNFVRATLENDGYRVEPVTDGETALRAYASAAARGDPFRLVLTDVVMPGMNGVDLVRNLLHRDPETRALFMSGHAPADCTQTDLTPQTFDLLSKPFRPEQLLSAVRSSLERKAARGRSRRVTPSLDGVIGPVRDSSKE